MLRSLLFVFIFLDDDKRSLADPADRRDANTTRYERFFFFLFFWWMIYS